jgi:hypothetical protein
MSLSNIFLDDKKSMYLIEDVLSEDSLNTLREFCDEESTWDKDEALNTLFYIKYPRPKTFSIMQEEIYESIIQALEPELISRMTMPFLRHSSENTVTNGYGIWSIPPNMSDHTIKKNFTFFINDDYEGGEFVFLDKDITFKPKKNSLLVHLSSDLYGSKEIASGYAYTFTEYLIEEEI